MTKRSLRRYSQRAGSFALASAFLASAFVAVGQAPASAGVVANGYTGNSLHVAVNGTESIAITCSTGAPSGNIVVTVAGSPTSPTGSPRTCGSLTQLTLSLTGTGANIVDLSGMTTATFTGMATTNAFPSPRTVASATWPVFVDLGGGNDTFTGSGLAEAVLGGTGNDSISTAAGDDVYFVGAGDGSGEAPNLGTGTDTAVVYGSGNGTSDQISAGSPSANAVNLTINSVYTSGITNVDKILMSGGIMSTASYPGVTDYSWLFAYPDGDDVLVADTSVVIPVIMIGGLGNDTLVAPFGTANATEAICSPLHGAYSAYGKDTLTINTTTGTPIAIDYVIDPALPSDPLAKISKMSRSGHTDGFARDCAVKTAGPAPQIGGGQFHPLAPYRVFDSRPGSGYAGAGTKVAPSVHNPVLVGGTGSGANSVPNNGSVSAVVLNVVATGTSAGAFLKVFPTAYPSSESGAPSASSLNIIANETRANNVTVGLGGSGYVALAPLIPMDVIVDVLGYYTSSTEALEPMGHFESISPERIFDTRPEEDFADYTGVTGPTNAGQTFNVDVADNTIGLDSSFLGDDIAAVVFNVTAIGLASDSFVTVWPAGSARPDASNINVGAGGVNPNLVVVPVGTGGNVSFYTHASMHVVADVLGFFTASGVYTSGRFVSTEPTRFIDTRDTGQQLDGNYPFAIQIDGNGIIPTGAATAVVANITAVPTASGYVSVFPGNLNTSPPFPPGSNLNTIAGKPVPNAVWSEISNTSRAEQSWPGAPWYNTGQIGVFFQSSGYVIVDVNGYFTAS